MTVLEYILGWKGRSFLIIYLVGYNKLTFKQNQFNAYQYRIKKAKSDVCRLCKLAVENTEHIFIHCSVTPADLKCSNHETMKRFLFNPRKKIKVEKFLKSFKLY